MNVNVCLPAWPRLLDTRSSPWPRSVPHCWWSQCPNVGLRDPKRTSPSPRGLPEVSPECPGSPGGYPPIPRGFSSATSGGCRAARGHATGTAWKFWGAQPLTKPFQDPPEPPGSPRGRASLPFPSKPRIPWGCPTTPRRGAPKPPSPPQHPEGAALNPPPNP